MASLVAWRATPIEGPTTATPALLGAVVEVLLQPAALDVSRLHDPGSGRPATPSTLLVVTDWLPWWADDGYMVQRPVSWEVHQEDGDLVFLAPDTGGPLRPRLTVSRERLDPVPALEDVTSARLEDLQATVPDFQLLDLEELTLASRPAHRTLAACRDGALSLTLEQWWTIDGNSVVTLTAVVPTMEYDDVADVLAQMAATFRLTGATS